MGRCLRIVSTIIHWLFFAVTVTLIVSGLGISYARHVEYLTLGFLNKAVSFKIHNTLWIPFLILLIAHITFIIIKKRNKK